MVLLPLSFLLEWVVTFVALVKRKMPSWARGTLGGIKKPKTVELGTYHLSIWRVQQLVLLQLVFGGERRGALGAPIGSSRTNKSGDGRGGAGRLEHRSLPLAPHASRRPLGMDLLHVLLQRLEALAALLALRTLDEVLLTGR